MNTRWVLMNRGGVLMDHDEHEVGVLMNHDEH